METQTPNLIAEPCESSRGLIFSKEMRMIFMYALSVFCISAGFYIGAYFFNYIAALVVAPIAVIVGVIFFFALDRKPMITMVFLVVVNVSIGLSISAFFTALHIAVNYQFALLLLGVAAFKSLQSFFNGLPVHKIARRIVFGVLLTAEISLCIACIVQLSLNPTLMASLFFIFMLCAFFSLSQVAVRRKSEGGFWQSAAIAYLLGFVFIFLAVVLLVISLLLEDGSPLEILFEIGGNAVGDSFSPSARVKKPKI